MKKAISIVMTLVILATACVSALSVFAADAEAVFTIDTIEKQAGETITAGSQFDISVSLNDIDALCMIGFKFRYNKQLMKPVSGTAKGVLAQFGQKTVNLAPNKPTIGNSNLYGEVWITGMDVNNKTVQAGPIATITFEALKDIHETTLIFCCEEPEVSDDIWSADLLTVDYIDGGIKFPAVTTTTTTTVAGDPDEAPEKVSLMPADAAAFTCKAGGEGTIEVSAVGDKGFKFSADRGWPNAYYMGEESEWVTVDTNDEDAILYYDFSVGHQANVLVFFEGQNPGDEGAKGTFRSLNTVINENNVDAAGNIIDLPAGSYKGQVHVKDLGCDEQFMTDGKFRISGMKVFAVGGTVIVNELAVVGVKGAQGDATTTTTEDTDVTTTVVNSGDTTTTTVKKDTAKQDSAKTGDVSNAVLFIIVAAVAAALIVVSVVMAKKKKK